MPYPDTLITKAKATKLLILDVDGVLTDGRLYFFEKGNEVKTFNTQDGYGLKTLQECGVNVAIISGHNSACVTRRMERLHITHVYQGIHKKLPVFETLLTELNLEASQCAYVGDDLPDLPIMERVGFKVAVANARGGVKAIADWVTPCKGGKGAVRDVCDLIIEAQQLEISYDT